MVPIWAQAVIALVVIVLGLLFSGLWASALFGGFGPLWQAGAAVLALLVLMLLFANRSNPLD